MELIKTVKNMAQLIETLQKQVGSISERLATIEEVIDVDLIVADKELDPEVAEENARTAAREAAEIETIIEAEEAERV